MAHDPNAVLPAPTASVGLLVGARIGAFRVFKGWSKARLSRVSGVDYTSLVRAETSVHDPALFSLALVATALEVDLTDLLATGPSEPSPGDALRAAKARLQAGQVDHPPGYVGLRVGAALKALRAAKGLNQDRMARALGVDPGTLCRAESGTRIPLLANLYRLCAAYGTTPYHALLPTLGDTSYANDFRSKFRA